MDCQRKTPPASASFLLGLGGIGVIGVGAVHALWGAGVMWPAKNREELAAKVVGSERFPPALACAAVAIPLVGTGAYALAEAGGVTIHNTAVIGDQEPQEASPPATSPGTDTHDAGTTQDETRLVDRVGFALPVAVGMALTTRGIVGGVAACKMLGLPTPNTEFQNLDKKFYRPLCLVLGGSLLVGKALARKGSA